MKKKRVGCLGCKWLDLSLGGTGWESYMTSSYSGYISCSKKHFDELEPEGTNLKKAIYNALIEGDDCPDFGWDLEMLKEEE